MATALGLPPAWTEKASSPTHSPIQAASAVRQTTLTSGCRQATMILLIIFFSLGLIMAIVIGRSTSTSTPTSSTSVAASPSARTVDENRKLAENIAQLMESPGSSATARLGYAQTLIKNHPDTPQATRASQLIAKLEADVAEEQRGKQWAYDSHEDSMTGKQTYSATVESTNSFEFDFPYDGRQKARLTLRRHPRWGKDVVLSIEHGQILCHTHDCPVRVRFDDESPLSFTGTGPSDNSSESVFIPAYTTFEKKLEKANRVRIEVNIFQQGVLVSDFAVDGFKPDRLKAR